MIYNTLKLSIFSKLKSLLADLNPNTTLCSLTGRYSSPNIQINYLGTFNHCATYLILGIVALTAITLIFLLILMILVTIAYKMAPLSYIFNM